MNLIPKKLRKETCNLIDDCISCITDEKIDDSDFDEKAYKRKVIKHNKRVLEMEKNDIFCVMRIMPYCPEIARALHKLKKAYKSKGEIK